MRQPASLTSTADGSAIAGDPKAGWLGWYFSDETEALRYGDGRKIKVGKTHKVKCEPVLCESGLHASHTVLKALNYAPGLILFRVKLGGTIVHGDDKSCATERTYLDRINADALLREFARKCALQVVHLWDCPRIVRDYLETGDEALRSAARSAVESAAESVARSAARSVAWSAARSAVEGAAWSAAESAAWSAAWSAARSVAWSAARSAVEGAAWSAARSAAWSAARSAQEKMLDEMVLAALKEEQP